MPSLYDRLNSIRPLSQQIDAGDAMGGVSPFGLWQGPGQQSLADLRDVCV